MTLFLIVVCGGIGALCRFIADGLLRTVLGRRFPWATIIINLCGSLLLGLVTGFALHHQALDLKLIIGTGFCGGFTTFSTASFETIRLLESKRYIAAFLQSAGNGALAIIAATVGLSLFI